MCCCGGLKVGGGRGRGWGWAGSGRVWVGEQVGVGGRGLGWVGFELARI